MTTTDQSTTPAPLLPGSSASYDPDDNKLRLETVGRLDSEDYARAKDCGFRWAPKQGVFFAVWSPAAEDLLMEWCGEIGDECSTMADRAAYWADRFEKYSAKREADGDRASAVAAEIAGGIPFGQPVLIGHHSERRARKDAERIDSANRKAVKMWETAEYWQRRAAASLAHANYKAQPAVRARRIKTLEAERRKRVASYTPHSPEFMQEPQNECWKGENHPRGETCHRCEPCAHVLAGSKGLGAWPVPVRDLPLIEKRQARWIAHLDLRISYERALLADQGAAKLLEKNPRPKTPPLLNYRVGSGEVRVWQRYGSTAELCKQVEMTRAEYQGIYAGSRWSVLSEDRTHRIRFAHLGGFTNGTRAVVFLTDSKAHPAPTPATDGGSES